MITKMVSRDTIFIIMDIIADIIDTIADTIQLSSLTPALSIEGEAKPMMSSGAASMEIEVSELLCFIAPSKLCDCMVGEQYNSKALRAESTILTECSNLAGVASGDRRHNGERAFEVPGRHY